MKATQILEYAILAAQGANGYSNKHGAVIFKGKRILSVGRNKQKKTPLLRRLKYRSCWLHAEADAILKADGAAKGANLLVIRIGKVKLRNSRPCTSCLSLIAESGIKDVFYSTAKGGIEKL